MLSMGLLQIIAVCASLGMLVIVCVMPFNPPIFFTIFGMAIIGVLWCIYELIDMRQKKSEK